MDTIEITLGIRDLMNNDAIEIHRDKVPPLPEGATVWQSMGGKHMVYDHGDQRWRYDRTGDLVAYYLYANRKGDIKEFWCVE